MTVLENGFFEERILLACNFKSNDREEGKRERGR